MPYATEIEGPGIVMPVGPTLPLTAAVWYGSTAPDSTLTAEVIVLFTCASNVKSPPAVIVVPAPSSAVAVPSDSA